MNQRVGNLGSCVSLFNLFGWDATMTRLHVMVGARPQTQGLTWTESELLAALDHLETARRSFVTFTVEQARVNRTLKHQTPAAKRLSQRDQFITWLASYLDGGHEAEWYVDGLGLCDRCSHRLIFHGSSRGCRACHDGPACTRPLPDPRA
jgi:hypothetical protein